MSLLARVCRWLARVLTGWADWLEPQAGAGRQAAQADTVTLHLLGADGAVRSEIALHGVTAPIAYEYAGVRYRRIRALTEREWEYQPYAR